jgi:hypothetical protein
MLVRAFLALDAEFQGCWAVDFRVLVYGLAWLWLLLWLGGDRCPVSLLGRAWCLWPWPVPWSWSCSMPWSVPGAGAGTGVVVVLDAVACGRDLLR